jgi:RNA polymerase sigma-70 factor (sigma-E family)
MKEAVDPTGVDGDAAFTAWVAAHRSELTRTAYLLCADRFLAEDLVQSCLTRLYLAWPRVATMDAPNAYARRALLNAHIDMTRRGWWLRERHGRGEQAATTDGRLVGGHAAGDELTAADERHGVVSALAALPPGQRRVVVLRFLWGLTVRETAKDLGISEGTVKSQTADALRHLAALLAPAVDGQER